MAQYYDLQVIRKRISSAHLEVSVRHELRARAKNAANGVGAHLHPHPRHSQCEQIQATLLATNYSYQLAVRSEKRVR